MENEPYSQALPLQSNNNRFQWLPTRSPLSEESDEGGLNLGQVAATLRRRIPVIAGITVVITSAALLKALTNTPIYQSGFEILTKPITVESQVISSIPQTLGQGEQQQQGQQSEKGVDETKLKLLKSSKILDPVVKELQAIYPEITFDSLAAGLVVTPEPDSQILSVSYQDKNPQKLKAILKRVSNAYLSYSLEERLIDVWQGTNFVNAQIPQLQKRVEDSQDRLQTFRQQFNLIDPESAGKQLAEQTSIIGQQRLEAQVQLNEARALYLELEKQLVQPRNESAAASALSENARYQSLLDQILSVESDIAKNSSLFRSDTPNIQVLRDQKQNLLPLLSREGQRVQGAVASKIRELEARNQILDQAERQLTRRIKQLSVVSRQYTDIQQELKISTDNLNQFLTKREALRIDGGQRRTPWQILTAPTDPVPSAANVKRTTLLGTILGLLLGIGAALVLEKLSNVLHTSDEVKEITKLPILGVVPFNSELPELEKLTSMSKVTSTADTTGLVQQMRQKFGLDNGSTMNPYSTSPFLEAFRSLYTNILLLGSDTRIRSLVISSSSSGEGKSTVAIYLAQAAAALGQRVLLVDADLRLPQLHEHLKLKNTQGLTQVISLSLDVETVIQRSPVENNLFVLTSGQIPPDPTKLLSSQKMQILMEQLRDAYDLVIYDTPPLLGLADTRIVASKTDGVAIVVGLDKTKGATLSQALEGLKLFPISVLGIVANGAKDYNGSLHASDQRYYTSERNEQVVEEKTSSTSK